MISGGQLEKKSCLSFYIVCFLGFGGDKL